MNREEQSAGAMVPKAESKLSAPAFPSTHQSPSNLWSKPWSLLPSLPSLLVGIGAEMVFLHNTALCFDLSVCGDR